jgi:general stress protein YciG
MPRETKGIIKDSEYYAEIGRIGGLKTKQRMLRKNRDYYAEIGLKGGQANLNKGKEYFSNLGKISGEKARLVREDA